ncbi:MAG: hypothetical protein C4520_12640 [Candidatus Abyssobacteria bacterium SURF_5]|uniref:SAM-dependent chlorinase/fluorinase n=1 Tax=Abyssobacteria bacterium (strain SURF_5) TaxID=2093360 RepID=A0A3A4NNH5_ABYX5|nr:MAG: hypothetical protein C4520_12640 [Candidatus Abyssubacteria bacterium SURF_5]
MSENMNPGRGGHLQRKCSSSSSFYRSERPGGVITLLTDFGLADAYVGVMKGVIAGINREASVIDLCHEVAPQNVHQAAFLLASSYVYFPGGAIHLAVVDPTVGGKRRAICVAAGDFFFVGPDNGILSIACSRAGIKEIRSLDNEAYFLKDRSKTFHGRDIFAPVAAHLSRGVPLAELGRKLRSMKHVTLPEPAIEPRRGIRGRIVYRDRFGNLISNIDRGSVAAAFAGIDEGRLVIRVGEACIKGLGESYSAVAPGLAVAFFGSYNFLEVGIRDGNAAEILKAGEGAEVRVEATGDSREERIGKRGSHGRS